MFKKLKDELAFEFAISHKDAKSLLSEISANDIQFIYMAGFEAGTKAVIERAHDLVRASHKFIEGELSVGNFESIIAEWETFTKGDAE